MKKAAQCFGLWALFAVPGVLALYGIGVFVELSFDPSVWTHEARALVGAVGGAWMLVAVPIGITLANEDE